MPARPQLYRLLAMGVVGAIHLLVLLLWPGAPARRNEPGPDQAPLLVQLQAEPSPRPAEPRERGEQLERSPPPTSALLS